MVRLLVSSVSALSLLAGFVAAPHTHLHLSRHDAASDPHHAHAVLHSHVTSHESEHEHGAPVGHDPHERDGLSVDSFVFQPAKNLTPAHAVAVLPRTLAPQASVSGWTNISRQKPEVYGSPPIPPSASRAPPILSPAAV
jgi:hypothetical protein